MGRRNGNKRRRYKKAKQSKESRRVKWLKDDIVVWSYRKPKACQECGCVFVGKRSLVVYQGKKHDRLTCIECMGLDSLAFLPAGNSKPTRRASKYSSVRAVIVRGRRKYVDRLGILVEHEAILRACAECDVAIPAGASQPIAGTKTVLAPTPAPSPCEATQATLKPRLRTRPSKDKLKQEATQGAHPLPATACAISKPQPNNKRQSKKKRQPQDPVRLAARIRDIFPHCSTKKARSVAAFAFEHTDDTDALFMTPVDQLSEADIGALVSLYLRRRVHFEHFQ